LCVEHGLAPGCLNVDEVDPDFRTDIAAENRERRVRRVVSNSFGFGGSNCSLVLGEPLA
jgi:3-oxoacyl-[acyl-carrier-protein] synthase-1